MHHFVISYIFQVYPSNVTYSLSVMRPPSMLRRIHTASSACNLVAPPDPMSNMRPIIYSDVSPAAPQPRSHHPYSLSEFTPEDSRGGKPLELQFKLQRQQLDEFHHNFWFDVRNTCLFFWELLTDHSVRAILDLKLPNRPFFPVCHLPQLRLIKKMLSLNSTSTGTSRRQSTQATTQPNGEPRTSL